MVKRILKYVLAAVFVAAGVLHFVRPATYVGIMPPYVPQPLLLVYLSGLAEVALGALVLVPRWTRPAGWGLIVLLVAVFPANVHMALHPEQFPQIPPAALWARLPLQGVLIAWAWWCTRPARRQVPKHDA